MSPTAAMCRVLLYKVSHHATLPSLQRPLADTSHIEEGRNCAPFIGTRREQLNPALPQVAHDLATRKAPDGDNLDTSAPVL